MLPIRINQTSHVTVVSQHVLLFKCTGDANTHSVQELNPKVVFHKPERSGAAGLFKQTVFQSTYSVNDVWNLLLLLKNKSVNMSKA